jgi:large subunit ribosomal protein L29
VTRVRELRDLGDEELVAKLDSSKEELFNLRFQLATGQLDNPMRIKDVRHDVARILTILRERDLEREVEAWEAEVAGVPGDQEEGPAVEAAAPGGGAFARRRRFRKEEVATGEATAPGGDET